MNARRSARELALLSFSQLSKNIDKWEDKELEDTIITSVRTLVSDAEGKLQDSVRVMVGIKEFIENYEFEHPENIEKPMDEPVVPVHIPLTSDMTARIDELIEAADKTYSAMDVVEIASLANKQTVKDYTVNIIKTYKANKKEIDEQISNLSEGWNIDRLVRIDRDILRIAIVELLYFPDIPIGTAIDEAVELAKKYSNEESSSFINGILRQVVEKNKLYKIKK